ncbi:MAG TPA: PBP1A family penicillin-binding protein [Vicinamibacterales bacterium]
MWRRRWVRWAAFAASLPLAALFGASVYFYITFGQLIDARLHGERDRTFPRVFARPLELRRGQSLSDRQLIDRLNDLGYAQTAKPEKPGEFSVATGAIAIMPRGAEFKGELVRVTFQKPPAVVKASAKRAPPRKAPDRVERLDLGTRPSERLTLDTPVLTSLISGEREKRRPVPLAAIPSRVIQAVLSIEDRRYYEHPGVDPIGIVGALLSNLRGKHAYTAGASTITQQVVRNIFLPRMFPGMTLQAAREKSLKRKALEAWVSVIVTQRASKDEILEMYLNDMTLGQRGSFGIVGVAEASRLFFGKHVSNVTLAEAATIAGVFQSPSALSPFTNPDRCTERRNVVLQAMVDAGYIEADIAGRASHEPLIVVQRALETEAPFFVDYVGQTLTEDYPGLTSTTQTLDVYTTLDLHLQRLAQDSVRDGLTHVDELLAHRKRHGKAEAALVALDPKTGEILAFVGGRSYNQSQYNRAIAARRQPGSVFKPFVYLTAFEQAVMTGRNDISPATIVDDSPTTWEYDDQVWTPENYEYTYDGPITFRHALAHSRNIAAVKVAEGAGYQNVANLWKRLGVANPPKPYPSIALGVFEATPYEIATAYTIFPNMGAIRPLRHILRITSGGRDVTKKPKNESRIVARPETTFLVTNMMRSVLNEGTAAAARAEGFTLDAAGKTGTTNDLRDAWFVGFTPDLLTVVWVGFDDNQPVGLTGARAALPIWTAFMKGALAGRASVPFDEPGGINWVEIDADTGKLAGPSCPKTIREAFIPGTEPVVVCDLHRN